MKKVKDLMKRVRKLADAKQVEEAQKLIPQTYQAIDKATKIGVLKQNTASRRKSLLARLVSKKES